ncbi:RNA-binding protein 20 [Colossoma macropomum]|uniref:RNA-binding protein 20 n=1 Tax=Colossoma macropomum TaxID=42526 RepID=UPI0018652D25|nr:RNA-binding protein 20 [Colossoma macropomum]
MKQAWDKSVFENGQTKHKYPGTGHVDSGTAAPLEHLQSSGSGDKLDKKAVPVGGALGGAGQNLLLSPASIQLAQLQAQLTLHRLKLAQTSSTAAAATVLNQVLSNVAMSQPLFNQLRGSSIGQAHGRGFPPAPITFPPPSTALGTLAGGGFSQNHAGIRLNHYGAGSSNQNTNQQGEYGKKAGMFQTDTDRRVQFGFTGVGPSKAADAGQYGGPGVQAKNSTQNNYQRDCYPSEGQQGVFMGGSGELIQDSGQKEQWKNPTSFPLSGKLDMGTGAGTSTWGPAPQGFVGPRAELYNPEEPTGEPRFSPAGGLGFNFTGGQPGFVGYQQQQKGEEGKGMTLQAHQLNDYHGATPSHLPHQCTICEKKVYNLKDWDQHVKGKLHLQNRSLYTEAPAVGALHFPAASEGCPGSALTNAMAYSSAAGQDVSAGGASYLPATAMKSFPLSGAGFTSHQPGAKVSHIRRAPGRVVHICNLPEGSCTENDVINLGLPFGKVTNYILMRSTHQAFLEMAYVEAAQAMVQYYQLQPAKINDQKLLIRMSKRYKELQLKKPGKDVESIIQDINSQRERGEMQDMDRYLPERARSRSPISRSLSPRSHSPSFTSCSSTHSPQGCRPDWINGLGPRRGSWDWTSHGRRDEDPRDRDEWRNGEDERPNGRLSERRKPYLKPGERGSPRMDERGRDWYPRGSPQGPPFSSYHTMDDFYKKEPAYKAEKTLRTPQNQRHEGKYKRRDGTDHHRARHSESDLTEDLGSSRAAEERGRSKRTSRRQEREDKETENSKEATEHRAKDRSSPPHNSKPSEPTECERDRDSEVEEWVSGEETEGESWYPKSMEELVTVDEVGGEDDSIIEPDLPDLQEEEPAEEPSQPASSPNPNPSTEVPAQAEKTQEEPLPPPDISPEKTSSLSLAESREPSVSSSAPDQPCSQLCLFPSQEFKSALEESSHTEPQTPRATPDSLPNHSRACEVACEREKAVDAQTAGETVGPAQPDKKETQHIEENQKRDAHISVPADSPQRTDTETPSPSREQEKIVSEYSIPLGVEFIVPRTGFYCKLCGLFYTSEETAKTTHCRSTVHYRNLQKYLSQLAEESLLHFHADPASTE